MGTKSGDFAQPQFRAPQTPFWLQKVQCSESTFVQKSPSISNLQNERQALLQ
jgi:hypothetical protein